MYNNRDLLGKKIINSNGKCLGIVEDLLIDIKSNSVSGIYAKKSSLTKKYFSVLKEDITYFGDNVICKRIDENKYFTFNNIKSMEVLDLRGEVLGTVENMLFSKKDFHIISLVISEGFLRNYIRGKRIILMKDLIIGDRNLLFVTENNYYFYSKIHGVAKDE